MTAHWFAPGLLATRLARSEISNREVAQFMLGNFLFGSAIYYGAVTWSNPPWTLLSLWEAALVVVVTVYGMVHCFEAGGGDDNPRFAADFNCLCFPIWLWTTIVVWVPFWILSWGYRSLGPLLMPADGATAAVLVHLSSHVSWIMTTTAIVASQIIFFVWMKRMMVKIRIERSAPLGR